MQLCIFSDGHSLRRRTLFFCFVWMLCVAIPGFAPGQDDDPPADLELGGKDRGVGGGGYWMLDFKLEALRTITPAKGPKKGRVYWYMLYTLENNTGKDREYFLSIHAGSENKKTYSDIFQPSVEVAIERKVGKRLWGQVDKFKILSKRHPEDEKYNYVTIKAGEKLSCVAVFNRLDPNANRFAIEVYGLSNDLEETKAEDGSVLVKERVRVLRFKRLGDEYEIDQDAFRPVDREWVKKATKVEKS